MDAVEPGAIIAVEFFPEKLGVLLESAGSGRALAVALISKGGESLGSIHENRSGRDDWGVDPEWIGTVTTATAESLGRVSTETLNRLLRGLGRRVMRAHYEACHQPKPFEAGRSAVPVAGRVYGAEEMEALAESAFDFWLTTGRFNDDFEKRFSELLGVRRVLTTNSGSSANLLALTCLTSKALGERALKPGDEVLTVAAGFPTTINPILQNGLVPVFVDVHVPTYNIARELIEPAISAKTKAIMIAHTLGNPFCLDEVMAVARRHGLLVVEDCCDALGSFYSGESGERRRVGSFGDLATYSFYPAHHLTMGEGGAVATNNSKLAKIVESFRDWGRDCWCPPGHDNSCNKRFGWTLGQLPAGYDHKYVYSHAGYNLKITDMQAAVGAAQLWRLPGFMATRVANFERLKAGLEKLRWCLELPEATPGSEPSWFGFPIMLRGPAAGQRRELLSHLQERKIGTRLLFAGNVLRQPYFEGREYRVFGELTETDRIMRDCFWIGVFPGLRPEMLDYVAETLSDFAQERWS